MGDNMRDRIKEVTVALSGTVSSAVSLESHEIFVGAIFPAMDNGAIKLQYSIDGGSNYVHVLDPIDGEHLIIAASGADIGVVDISDYIRFVHANNEHLLRFTCASQSSGAVTITVLLRG